MSRKTRPFSSRILFTAIAALLTASRGGASTASAIYSAVLNASDNQVTIAGDNFSPSGLAPTVVFGRAALALVSFTNRKLVATPPAGLSAGSYSLTVTNSVPQSGAFSVSIGALGPAGPADPQEPQRALGTRGTAAILSGYCNFSRPLREGDRIRRWVSSFCSASSAFPAADHIASTASTRPVPITKLPISLVARYHPQVCCRI